jgi:hypothetical protein
VRTRKIMQVHKCAAFDTGVCVVECRGNALFRILYNVPSGPKLIPSIRGSGSPFGYQGPCSPKESWWRRFLFTAPNPDS